MKLEVEREGLGYRAYHTAEGVGLHLDRIVESRSTGEVSGELSVALAPDGHLVRTRFNLLSMTTRTSLAKHLTGLAKLETPWLSILETFCLQVLELVRAGEKLETVGDKEPSLVLDYLVEPLLTRGKETILFGSGGIGKSTLAVAMAVSLESGQPVFPGWKVPRAGKVLILDWEDDGSTWNDRIRKCATGFGIEPPVMLYQRMRQPLHGAINDIASKVALNGIDLLIVDSVTRAMPGAREGSDASDSFKRLWDALELLATSALLIDHVSKLQEGTRERTTPYGSVMKANWARAMFELREDEEDDDKRVRHLVLLDRKENHVAKGNPVGIRLHYSPLSWVLGPEEPRLGDEKAVRDAVLWMRVKAELGRAGKLSITELTEALGLQGKDPERRIREACARKPSLFGKTDDGRYFLLDTAHSGDAPAHAPPGEGRNRTPPQRGGGGAMRPPSPDTAAPSDAPGKFDELMDMNDEAYGR